MPTSPLPNFSAPDPAVAAAVLVAVVVVALSLPQAARKATRALEPPVTASSLRRETGSLTRRDSALSLFATAMLPSWVRGGFCPPLRALSQVGSAQGARLGGRASPDALQRPVDTRDP